MNYDNINKGIVLPIGVVFVAKCSTLSTTRGTTPTTAAALANKKIPCNSIPAPLSKSKFDKGAG